MYEIDKPIDFIYRETILHMDIKSQNIVFDKHYNARLVDFGLAREMREGQQEMCTTTKEIPRTEGYYRRMEGEKLTKHADFYNFGVGRLKLYRYCKLS